MQSLMKRLVVAIMVLMGLASGAFAQAADPAGRWAVRSQGRPMVILTLQREADGWRGEMEQPATLTTDGTVSSLTEVSRPRIARRIISARETPEGLALTVAPPPSQRVVRPA